MRHWHLHELRQSGASLMLAPGIDLFVSQVLGPSSVASMKDAIRDVSSKAERRSCRSDVQRQLTANGYRNGSQSVRTRRGYRLIAEKRGKLAHPEVLVS